jgi:hypothetical protein
VFEYPVVVEYLVVFEYPVVFGYETIDEFEKRVGTEREIKQSLILCMFLNI